MAHLQTPQDILAQHARPRRVSDLLTGVTPMRFYTGAFGLNTSWGKLTPSPGWKYSNGESYIRWRLRSDVVYLDTVGSGGLTPVAGWPNKPALHLPGKPNVSWPSYRAVRYCPTTAGGSSLMTVKPDGRIFFTKPGSGIVLQPKSVSWPRG